MLLLLLCAERGKRFQTFPISAGAVPPSVDARPCRPPWGTCTWSRAHTRTHAKFPSRMFTEQPHCDVSAVMSHETPWHLDYQCERTKLLHTCLPAACLLAAWLWFCCLVCEDDGKMETLCCCCCCRLEPMSRIWTDRARTNFNTAPQRWKGDSLRDSPAISHCAVEESMPGMSCLHFNDPQSDWHDHKFADLEWFDS